MQDCIYNRGWVHSNIRRNERSRVVALTITWLLGEKTTRPSNTDHLLRPLAHNTPHPNSSVPCKDKTHWGTVSSHSRCCNLEKARSLEDWYRGEYRWLPHKTTPSSTLRRTKNKVGTPTSARAEKNQTRNIRVNRGLNRATNRYTDQVLNPGYTGKEENRMEEKALPLARVRHPSAPALVIDLPHYDVSSYLGLC